MSNKNNNAYLIYAGENYRFENYIEIGINNLKLYYNNCTVIKKNMGDKTLILMGRVVDSNHPHSEPDSIAESLIKSSNIDELIENSKGLAGRFIILYSNGKQLYIFPDAVASIPVTFTTHGELSVASNPRFVAEMKGWHESDVSREIKNKAAPTHPLPYDLTMYDQMRKVPPNHYFDFRARKAIRFYPIKKEKPVGVEEASEISSKLLKNVVIGYHNRYRLSLPLTSGVDSRTILALCRDFISEIPTYTFFHDHFTDKTADIAIPRAMAEKFGFEHFTLRHIDLPPNIMKECKVELGSLVNPLELQNAWTYYNHHSLKNFIRLDGNISPLGKSSFGRDLPELLATTAYLVTKTHNYSKKNKQEVARWHEDIRHFAKQSDISKYDLFFWEHRVGNWTSNSYLNADLFTNCLNVFNSRAIIETWLRVPRKYRKDSEIHQAIIRKNWPELLDFPFNPDAKYEILYKNPLIYYFAVRGKYIIERHKY